MQYFRRVSIIRSSFRSISNLIPSTTEKELFEINKLMQTYNNSHIPIRTIALFEWMLNITNLQPNFNCYLQILRACNELNNLNLCQKIHQFIDKDQTLPRNEYRQLQIKLIYMYSKIKHIEFAERIFHQAKTIKDPSTDAILFGTMFKGYNINGQSDKTIKLYENEKTIELDRISAVCVLSACSDCHRLDIGKYVHDEVRRLKLLNPPNIRLATAIMDMYCNCGSMGCAQELFNQLLPIVDHVAYSTLMKGYLSINQPVQVLRLFNQLQSSSSSSISPDAILYLNIIHTGHRLGLLHQAENIHRAIPLNIIEKNLSLQIGLIDMHAHCLHLNEACRLFNLLQTKENSSVISLLHGYAINGQGQVVLDLFQEMKSEIKFNEQSYKMILFACALTGGLVNQAREVYQTIPEKYKTSELAAVMVSILARASLFDEVQSFIHQYKSTSQNISPLWSALFIVCYHSGNISYAKLIYNQILDDPFLLLLYADMRNSLPSNEVVNFFRQKTSGICWTEIESHDKTGFILHEFHDYDLKNYRSLSIIIDELQSVGVNWEFHKNDLKELFCGHISTRLALAQHLTSTPSKTVIQLTKTKSTCHVCHEGMKQLTLLRQCEIILRDNLRVHHFHNGQCSCHDQF